MKIQPIRQPWPGTMTGRERFRRQMSSQSVDRCFNMEFGYWDENFTEWKMFRDNGIRSNAEADRFFGFDRIECIGGNTWMSPPFESKVIETRGSSKILINGDGLARGSAARRARHHPALPQGQHRDARGLEAVQGGARFRRDDPARKIDVAALQALHPETRDYPLGVYCGSMIGKIRDMLTFEGLAYAMFDYPEMVEDMVETCCVLVEDALDQLLPHFRFDFASGLGGYLFQERPDRDRRFLPRYRDAALQAHRRKLDQYGIDLWYTDCDGDVRRSCPISSKEGSTACSRLK